MKNEFFYEKASDKKSLSKDLQEKLVSHISQCYTNWQEARKPLLENSQKLISEIFFKNSALNFESDRTKRWKSKIKMCKIYMLYQTLKAFIWRNVYSTPNSMFDVCGENDLSENNANKQKAALVHVFNKMKLSKCLDKIIDASLLYGDLIAFVGWQKQKKQIRRPQDFWGGLLKFNLSKPGQSFVTQEVTTYDNPYVYDINPVNFVFDTTQTDNWDSCAKILKSFKTPNEIKENPLYSLSDEAKKFLEEIVYSGNSAKGKSKTDFNLKNDIVSGDTVEILEHWGDIKLADGTILENWHVVVLARKYIIGFTPNRFVENPFVYGYYLLDPEIKRPISPLQCIYDLALIQEELTNRTMNMQTLNENPPIYAPKGFFTEDEIELYPGKVITFDPNLYQTVPLTPMNFRSDVYMQDIMHFDKLVAEVSGIFPNMSGQLDRNGATATEINIKTEGQTTRLAMILDIINQDLLLPIVEKTAALLANFKFAPEQINYNKDGKNEYILIDNAIRQGEFEYTYSDRNSLFEKFSNAEATSLALEKFGRVLPLNWKEIFKWYWEQKGVDNPEKFLNTGVEDPIMIPPFEIKDFGSPSRGEQLSL